MQFIKYFCRLITEQELDNQDVAEYYDIVQSVVSPKVVVAHSEDGEDVEATVLVYEGEQGVHIYEIVLTENVDMDEGEVISDELAEAFEFDFEFESSLEI